MDRRRQALIIGCGYLGARIGRRLLDQGYDVLGTTRREARLDELRSAGLEAALFDLAQAPSSPLLRRSYDVVVHAVAPGRAEENAALVYRDGLAACLDVWTSHAPGRFILLSSTGVYAQEGGAWIDERSPAEPAGERQRLLVEGERLVLDAAGDAGFPGIVLRLGGLYGPDRSPVEWCRDPAWRVRLARGNREAYMNWVHADDAASAVVLAAEKARSGEVYLIVDDEPVPRGDFYRFACERGGSPPLELPSDPSRLAKRCSNRKAREELGFAPAYPSYREGLAALTR
jgi:nucleoside-diphosphate-sugar epimerase